MTPFRLFIGAVVAMAFFGNSLRAESDIVLEDAFTQGINDWKQVAIAAPKARKFPSGTPGMVLNNRIAGRALRGPLKENFTLEVKVMHGGDGACAWFGLFDSLLEKGYVVLWECMPAQNGQALSRAGIWKAQATADRPLDIHLKGGEKLSPVKPCATKTSTQEPPTVFTLSWESQTGELVLTCNGEELSRANDPDFKVFEAVIFSGNKETLYQSVTIKGH